MATASPDSVRSWSVADHSRERQEHPELSYSYRERSADVWRNRIGVTSLLFSVGMTVSYLLGRPRR